MRVLAQQQDSFDVVAVYLPERWRPAFTEEDDFDLHDAIKAVGAHLFVPTQVLNDDPWTYRCRASVAWRLTIEEEVLAFADRMATWFSQRFLTSPRHRSASASVNSSSH